MIIHKSKGDILIDDEDAGLLRGWSVEIRKGYVRLRKEVNGKRVRRNLARVILGDPVCFAVDHANRNTLDNRKCNLRACTRSQNARNNKSLPSNRKIYQTRN